MDGKDLGGSGFKDHFSGHSRDYARARPGYPESLFDHIASLASARDAAWDCGTGTGQAARSLASRFRAVIATDASANQVSKAARGDRILYAAAAAERAPLRNASVDLVSVAQALHWFDFPSFFGEVRRVARPGAVFAAWCYGNCHVSPEVDGICRELYDGIVGAYWPPERVHVEDGYASIPMPFRPLASPPFSIEVRWDLEGYLAYLETWSSVRYYRKAKGEDPLALVRDGMARAWGDPAEPRTVAWPLSLKLGRID
jgi:SAM-dependent methyltransferase